MLQLTALFCTAIIMTVVEYIDLVRLSFFCVLALNGESNSRYWVRITWYRFEYISLDRLQYLISESDHSLFINLNVSVLHCWLWGSMAMFVHRMSVFKQTVLMPQYNFEIFAKKHQCVKKYSIKCAWITVTISIKNFRGNIVRIYKFMTLEVLNSWW